MKVVFDQAAGSLILSLSSHFRGGRYRLYCEDDFADDGVKLREVAACITDQEGGAGQDFYIDSREVAFKIMAIILFKELYSYPPDYSRSNAVSDFLSGYQELTQECRNQCDAFLMSLLEKPNKRYHNEDLTIPPLNRFLNRIYNWLPAPLIAVINDNLPENQTLLLVNLLAYQCPARYIKPARRNIDLRPSDAMVNDELYSVTFYSPLIHACRYSSPAVVRLMIEKSPGQLNLRCELRHLYPATLRDDERKHETAIHAAAARGDVNLLQVLLDHGADLTLTNRFGETPLHLAQNPACVRLLIKAGADIHALDCQGATALHAACDGPFDLSADAKDLPQVTRNNSEKCRLLIQAGARVNQPDGRENTPLHTAVRSLFKNTVDNGLYVRTIIKTLCEHGANPNLLNRQRTACDEAMTPLLYLYENEVIDGSDGRSLSISHENRNKNTGFNTIFLIARLLVDYGADPAVCSSKGETILDKLAKMGDSAAKANFLNMLEVKVMMSLHGFWEQKRQKTERRQAQDDNDIIRRCCV